MTFDRKKGDLPANPTSVADFYQRLQENPPLRLFVRKVYAGTIALYTGDSFYLRLTLDQIEYR